MEEYRNKLKGLLWGLLTCLIISLWCNWRQWEAARSVVPAIDTTTVLTVRTDTVRDAAPATQGERVTGHVTVPYSSFPRKTGIAASVIPDSEAEVGITFPLVQRIYSDDSTYTAWVSGAAIDSVRPRLDSIEVYQRTVTETITIRQTLTVPQRKWLHIGPAAGVGYGLTTRQVDAWVGVSLTIEF